MPFFEVTKVMQYTVTVYVEADTKKIARGKSGAEEGEANHDDSWQDSHALEITEEEYIEATT